MYIYHLTVYGEHYILDYTWFVLNNSGMRHLSFQLIDAKCRTKASVNSDSSNDVSPVRRQAIASTSADMLPIWIVSNKFQWTFIKKYNNFIQESVSENVVFTMAAILFGAQYCIFNWWVIVCIRCFVFTTSRCHHIIFINLFIFCHNIVFYGSHMISSCTGGSHKQIAS